MSKDVVGRQAKVVQPAGTRVHQNVVQLPAPGEVLPILGAVVLHLQVKLEVVQVLEGDLHLDQRSSCLRAHIQLRAAPEEADNAHLVTGAGEGGEGHLPAVHFDFSAKKGDNFELYDL